jgi:hypothetical protein
LRWLNCWLEEEPEAEGVGACQWICQQSVSDHEINWLLQ